MLIANFQVTSVFCPHSVALGMFLDSKLLSAHTADSSVVQVAPNKKKNNKDGNPNFHPPLSLRDFLREKFACYRIDTLIVRRKMYLLTGNGKTSWLK